MVIYIVLVEDKENEKKFVFVWAGGKEMFNIFIFL